MRIQVGGLSDGIYQYALAEDVGVLELDGQFQGQVAANVKIEKSGSQIFLAVALTTQAMFGCDRCLSPFLVPLSSSYRMYYLAEGSSTGSIDPMEVQFVPPGFSLIDMSEDVRQTVLLSVPLKLLCTNDCKGLCPHCGTNWNSGTCTCTEWAIDPRWEQLIKLKKQQL